jgi:methylmalonyl-CoA mutase C-terminal domain/subunit
MAYKKRIIMAKMGLDAHDNGLRIVSKWLVDRGYEVIYAGVYNYAERILQMTIEEGSDAVVVSFLGGDISITQKSFLTCLKKIISST